MARRRETTTEDASSAAPKKRSGTQVFTAVVKRLGPLYCVHVPLAVSRALGGDPVPARVPVIVRIDGEAECASTLVPRGGGAHLLFVNTRMRAGARAGTTIRVALAFDPSSREVEAPEDLLRALREEDVLDGWELMPPGRRGQMIKWIEQTAYEATRGKRIARVIEMAHARREKKLER